jgi:PAS domain S-box-containing protein
MEGTRRKQRASARPDPVPPPGSGDPEQRYQDLVVHGAAGVLISTIQGQILDCNDAFVAMLGFADKRDVLKLRASELYPFPEDRERFLVALRSRGRLLDHALRLKHVSGQAVDVRVNIFLHEQPDGPAIIQGTYLDVTAHDRARQEHNTLLGSYTALLEHMRDGLLLVVDGKIQYANPAAIALVGTRMVGRKVTDLFERGDRERLTALLRTVRDDADPEPLKVRMNGNENPVVVYAARTIHDGSVAVQLTLQDHSVQQDLEKERQRVQMVEEINQVLRLEIAEHRRTQDQLRHSRRFARSLVDSSLDMIIAADPQGIITEYNPAASIRFGWEQQEVLGQNAIILYADPVQYHHVQEELNLHGVFAGEIRNVTRYGEVFTSFLAASRLYDEDGQFLGAMGVSRDITQMMRDQEALRISEERYRDLFENASDLIQSIDRDGRFEYVNHAWKRTLGYGDHELDAITIHDLVAPEHRQTFKTSFDRMMETGGAGNLDTVLISKSGQPVMLEGTTSTRMQQGRPVAIRTIFRDVTHMHIAREKVQAHEAKLRALFESSEHMFWTVARGMKLTSFNRGYERMIERLYGNEPLEGTDPIRPRRLTAAPDHIRFWEEKYAEAFDGQALRFETDLVDVHGARVSHEFFLSPVFGPDGKVTELFGVGHEITEQKIAEDLVREQAARLKAIFESSANMMIWTLDTSFRITSFNEHFQEVIEKQHGISFKVGDDFVKTMSRRVAGGRYKPLIARYQATLKGKAQQFEVELLDRNGRSIWVENFINPIEVNGRVSEISCLAYGITDRKEAQMEILRSLNEKEVLLKEVHHRVKNNLQVISSILSLQTAHVGDDKRILDLLRDSRDRIRSMSFIHESLYQTKDFSSIDLANYIEGLSRNLMMSYSLTGKVGLNTDLKQVHLVLDQAIPCGLILNELISNALKHAFPDGRAGLINISLETMNELVTIKVSDDGVGVSKEFDMDLHGNLGLELVRTLVDQLDGRIEMGTGPGVSYLLTFERTR